MSGLILRSCGRALRRTSHFRAGFTNSRSFSTQGFSFLPRKRLDGVDKVFLGSFLLTASSGVVFYYRSLDELTGDHLAKLREELTSEVEEAPAPVPVPETIVEQEVVEPEPEPVPEAEPEVLEPNVTVQAERVKQLGRELEQETTKFKELASLIATKLDEEIQLLKDGLDGEDSTEKKVLLLDKMAELRHQIKSLGSNGDELLQSYLLRKLAMVTGVFAYERAMLNGEPLQSVALILKGDDPLVDSALSALPEEAVRGGSWTPLQLQSKFYETKPKLRELAVVPDHLPARNGSETEVEESRESSEENGVENVLGRVESFMKEGNFLDAADALEHGFEGTEAQNLATEWAKQARVRAAIEQVHNVLRAHATSVSMSMA